MLKQKKIQKAIKYFRKFETMENINLFKSFLSYFIKNAKIKNKSLINKFYLTYEIFPNS